MSCLSVPPRDPKKDLNPIALLVIVVFVLLAIIAACAPAGANSRVHADPSGSTLGYWGMCTPNGACYSATLRFKAGDRTFGDCLVAMWSVGTVLSSILTSDSDIRTKCVRAGEPAPAWWRAMRKDETSL